MAKTNVFTTDLYDDFSGGINYHFGARQVDEKESPNAVNCDFKGRKGVGNRTGYSEVGAVADSRTVIYGMTEYHTSALDQLIKVASDGADVALYKSTGGAWVAAAGNTFTDSLNVDFAQAALMATAPTPNVPVSSDGLLFSGNGTDAMQKFDGTTVAAHTNGTIGFYTTFYNKRLWVVDETNKDTLNFSTASPDVTKQLDFVADGVTKPGSITFRPGEGKEIRGMVNFKNALYVFFYPVGIYKVSPAAAADTFDVELITNSVGCISHRTIQQVEEDIFFAADDGVYSLGDVANYTAVRTTNKSAKIQQIFDNLSATNKEKLCAVYHNFKYHLFYSLFGASNDSCIPYDIRYKGWQDWRNVAANDATIFTDSTGDTQAYFGEPLTGEVNQMYDGTTDDGTAISSTWYSPAHTQKLPYNLKIYDFTTFTFGVLTGTVTLNCIFDDTVTSATETLTQVKPQGGFGRNTLGGPVTAALYGTAPKGGFGSCDQDITVSQVVNAPRRMKAKEKKFSVQYRVASTGDWRLDSINQHYMPMDFYSFPSANKL